MPAPKLKYTPEPRAWTDSQVAARLNMSVSYFSDHKQNLYRAGMPQPDPVLGNKTDSKALECWLDTRSGLVDRALQTAPDFDEFRAAVRESVHGAGRA